MAQHVGSRMRYQQRNRCMLVDDMTMLVYMSQLSKVYIDEVEATKTKPQIRFG